MIKYILPLVFSALSLISCSELDSEVEFSEPIKGRTINLPNKVGESFQILRGSDTVRYNLYFINQQIIII